MSTSTLKFTAADFEVRDGRTLVVITYLPFASPPVGFCNVTIYTATGPRHPVLADIEFSTMAGWHQAGTQLVNNYPVGLLPSTFPSVTKFAFDCPAPNQFWEINIQTAPFNPLPDFLDSLIPSCEARAFVIVYPGYIARSSTNRLIDGTFADVQIPDEQTKAMAEAQEQLEAGYEIIKPYSAGEKKP